MLNVRVEAYWPTHIGNALIVTYSDGYKAVWKRSLGGPAMPDTFDAFILQSPSGTTVARYQSRYQHPQLANRQNGFVKAASRHTLELILEYWLAADRHIIGLVERCSHGRTPVPNDLHFAQSVIIISRRDREEIERGDWPLPG